MTYQKLEYNPYFSLTWFPTLSFYTFSSSSILCSNTVVLKCWCLSKSAEDLIKHPFYFDSLVFFLHVLLVLKVILEYMKDQEFLFLHCWQFLPSCAAPPSCSYTLAKFLLLEHSPLHFSYLCLPNCLVLLPFIQLRCDHLFYKDP